MHILKFSTASLVLSFILGCSSQNAEPPGVATPGVETPPPAKTVFDPLTQQIDRARAVQNTVDANADSTRKAIDDQEHGDRTP
ncbi:MAG: hypothetical protein M3O41_19595 [Pseudomonadota bacterium]|nr:hypothetical protein [Pseudomonadota bacterium]